MKRVLRYSAAGFLIALAYLGWIALTRYNANQEFEREAAQSETARYKKLVPASTELKITQFYTSRQEAARGVGEARHIAGRIGATSARNHEDRARRAKA